MRIYITIIAILWCSSIHAQNFKGKQQLKANTITYDISDFNNQKSKFVAISNIENTLEGKIPKVYSGNLTNITLKSPKGLLISFQSVFSEERIKELLPEDGLSTYMYVNPAGKVLEVVFFLSKDTKVTPFELEALEKAIKKNVVFNLNPSQTKGGDFFILTKMNKYQKVLDGTLEWD